MKKRIDTLIEAGASLPEHAGKRKYNKNAFNKDFDYSLVLKNALSCGMIAGDDVMNSSKEDIMKTILPTMSSPKVKKFKAFT